MHLPMASARMCIHLFTYERDGDKSLVVYTFIQLCASLNMCQIIRSIESKMIYIYYVHVLFSLLPPPPSLLLSLFHLLVLHLKSLSWGNRRHWQSRSNEQTVNEKSKKFINGNMRYVHLTRWNRKWTRGGYEHWTVRRAARQAAAFKWKWNFMIITITMFPRCIYFPFFLFFFYLVRSISQQCSAFVFVIARLLFIMCWSSYYYYYYLWCVVCWRTADKPMPIHTIGYMWEKNK